MPELMDGERRERVCQLVNHLLKAHLLQDATQVAWHLWNAETPDLYRMSRELRTIADDLKTMWEFRKRQVAPNDEETS